MTNSSARFQVIMNKILKDLINKDMMKKSVLFV